MDTSGGIVLVGPEIEENLALRHLAAALERAGTPATIVRLDGPADFGRALDHVLGASEPPLAVALSLAFQLRAKEALAFAVALRDRGYRGHLTGGGHFATFTARELLTDFPELDSVCLFEAEDTLVDLAHALARGQVFTGIPGLACRDAAGTPRIPPARPAPELTRLPWPDRRGTPRTCIGHRIAALVASRGCYADCSFCCINAFHSAAHPRARFRHREVGDVAAEMGWLAREHGRDVFIFHDDTFFAPGERRSLARLHALADALEREGMGRFATVVKARPTDITPEVVRVLRERLGLTRVFLGVETNTTQGLRTLRRKITPRRNLEAMAILREQGVYVSFNMLIFDPDCTLDGIEENLDFLQPQLDMPWNFGRVELYAGTPLLAAMQARGAASGDYLGWDYRIADPRAERVWRMALKVFFARNFAGDAIANRLQGTRFEVELLRHFHPERFEPALIDEARRLSHELGADSISALRELVSLARADASAADESALVAALAPRLRATERRLGAEASALEWRVRRLAAEAGAPAWPLPAKGLDGLSQSATGEAGERRSGSGPVARAALPHEEATR